MDSNLKAIKKVLTQKDIKDFFVQGLECENLRTRLDSKGFPVLSIEGHPESLGKSLTHPWITTDFSESHLEMVTPQFTQADKLLDFLKTLKSYIHQHLPKDEFLWNYSMPPLITDQDIKIAYYGPSLLGRFKTLYRQGLTLRYGKKLQSVSGLHYNLSFSESLLKHLFEARENKDETLRDFKDNLYFKIIQFFNRHLDLFYWLFGASPAFHSSFIQGRESFAHAKFDFSEALTLRLSRLGYHNGENISVRIDSLKNYVQDLKKNLSTPSPQHASLEKEYCRKTGECLFQLSPYLLQSENEFYTAIRAKRVHPFPSKRLVEVLEQQGVEYLEFRFLDLNPLKELGVDLEEIQFIQLLTMAAVFDCWKDSSSRMPFQMNTQEKSKLIEIAEQGRKHSNQLKDFYLHKLNELFDLAQILDQTTEPKLSYVKVLEMQLEKIKNPKELPASKVLDGFDLKDPLFEENFFKHLAQKSLGLKLHNIQANADYWQQIDLATKKSLQVYAEKYQQKVEDKDLVDFIKKYTQPLN